MVTLGAAHGAPGSRARQHNYLYSRWLWNVREESAGGTVLVLGSLRRTFRLCDHQEIDVNISRALRNRNRNRSRRFVNRSVVALAAGESFVVAFGGASVLPKPVDVAVRSSGKRVNRVDVFFVDVIIVIDKVLSTARSTWPRPSVALTELTTTQKYKGLGSLVSLTSAAATNVLAPAKSSGRNTGRAFEHSRKTGNLVLEVTESME